MGPLIPIVLVYGVLWLLFGDRAPLTKAQRENVGVMWPFGVPFWGWLGLGVIGVGAVVLVDDTPGLNTCWFLFAWVGWLLFVDGLIERISGESFAKTRSRELFGMLVFSMAYWTVYEQLNLRLHNWYYVWVPRRDVWQALYGALAFSTVLPACFFHADLLRVAGLFRDTRWRELRVGVGLQAGLLLFGLACCVLPMVWPTWFFWMIWGAPLGIPLVLNRWLGAESLLADLESGRPGRLLRLLAGGVIAGGLWESLNFWSRTKWVYTVPGFEVGKLFEMPWLGFVGFPVLSVASFSIYSLWCHFARGGRHWERADYEQPALRSRHRGVAMAAVVVFSVTSTLWPLQPVVFTRAVLGARSHTGPPLLGNLERRGCTTPECIASMSFAELRLAVDLPNDELRPLYDEAQLLVHKGMGSEGVSWLAARGVHSLEELAAADPDELRLRQITGNKRITPAMVRVWVREAQGGQPKR